MILKSYTVKNWGPHKNQTLVFPENAKTIALCAENDQGKSWILRGIGFTLSIGRNEYGDQTSIHAGETEAYHHLCIEHNNQTHTIEKIVRNKTSDNEGTLTLLNGQPADRSKFEEFYNQTLGLPLPSIWLPLTISMQNQTDFHLRSKKSEREEALRSACQLNKIDNWKDALQTKTNEEEKKLLAEGAHLQGSLENLQKEKTYLENEQSSLSESLAKLNRPLPSSPLCLDEILASISALEDSEKRAQKIQLEILTQQKTVDLLTTTLTRLQTELHEIGHGNPDEENAVESHREDILLALQEIQKKQLLNRLKTATLGLTQKLKEKEQNPEPSPQDILALETLLQKSQTLQQSLQEKVAQRQKLLQQLHFPDKNAENIQKEAENTEKIYAELLQNQSAKEIAQTALQAVLGPVTEPNQAADALKTLTQNEPPICETEARHLTLRLLQHWDHYQNQCPTCSQNLTKTPLRNPKQRALLQSQLETDLQNEPCELLPSQTPLPSLFHHLANWRSSEKKIHALCGDVEPTAFLTQLKTQSKNLLKDLVLHKQITSQNQDIQALEDKHTPLLQKKSPEENQKALQEMMEKKTRSQFLTLEIQHLHKEIDGIETTLETLPKTGAQTQKLNPALQNLSVTDLEEELEKITKKLSELRKSRHTRATKERELLTQQNQLQNSLGVLQKLETQLLREKELQIPLQTPTPPAETTEAGKIDPRETWRRMLKERNKKQTLLEEIPKRLTQNALEQKTLLESLTEKNRQKAKTLAARKLTQFLDYKNAPRKLLQNITEKLFQTTNQLGDALCVDVKLHVGKNLEFLTQQTRNGKLIEQKTERLGFGKGAILGICFRLACQKLLLPETGFLILDEPTANVDLKRKSALKTFLQNLAEETSSGTKQIILIEHDLDVIELCQAKIHIGVPNPN
jgi:DNA repair exonuclease SbcCD ATPase subunit